MARTKFTCNLSSGATTTDTQTTSTTTTTTSSAQMVVEAILNSLPAKFTYSEQRTETQTHRRNPQHKEQEQHERRADPDYEPESESESESESDSESDWEPYKSSAKRKRASKHTRTHKNTKKAARGVCPLGTGLPTPTQAEAEAETETQAETEAEAETQAKAVAGPGTWALDVPLDKEGRVVSPQSPTVHGCAQASVGAEFLRHYGMSLVLLKANMTVLEQEVTFLAGKVDSLVKFQPASFYTFGLRQTALKNYVRELLDCAKLRELVTSTGNWLVDVKDMDVNSGAYAGLTIPKELVRKTVVARAMVQRGHSSIADAIVSLQQLLLKHVVKVVLGHGLRQQQGADPSTLQPLFPKPKDESMFMLAGALYFDARV